eukprot:12961174-Ditylum_brightwellii.AAC.1
MQQFNVGIMMMVTYYLLKLHMFYLPGWKMLVWRIVVFDVGLLVGRLLWFLPKKNKRIQQQQQQQHNDVIVVKEKD